MSVHSAGNYYIFNRVSAPDPEEPAITFNDKDNNVTPFTKASETMGGVRDYVDGKTRSASPIGASSLQIGMGKDVLGVLAPGGPAHTIKVDGDGVTTVQDGGCTVYRRLDGVVSDIDVEVGEDIGVEGED